MFSNGVTNEIKKTFSKRIDNSVENVNIQKNNTGKYTEL